MSGKIRKARQVKKIKLKFIKLKTRESMKMSIVVKLVCLMLCIVSSRSITVRNGAYENFVIEIQKDISEDDCSQFISNLEVRFLIFFIRGNIYDGNRKKDDGKSDITTTIHSHSVPCFNIRFSSSFHPFLERFLNYWKHLIKT